MEKTRILLILFLSVTVQLYSQSFVNSWGLGAGISYPRFISISSGSVSENVNFGGYVSLQNKLTNHLSLRLLSNYSHMESQHNQASRTQKLDMLSGNLDVIYDVFPCEIISPFVLAGVGITNSSSKNSLTQELNKNFWGYQMNLGLGFELKLTSTLSIKSEGVYRTSSDNKIDGNLRVNEIKGLFRSNGDTYMTMDVGTVWYFSSGRSTA